MGFYLPQTTLKLTLGKNTQLYGPVDTTVPRKQFIYYISMYIYVCIYALVHSIVNV